MKRALALLGILFSLSLFGLLLVLRPRHVQNSLLSLTVPKTIQVGAALSVTASTSADTPVMFTLFTGIQRLAKTVTSDANGVATWQIPTETVISAGDSLIIAHVNGDGVRQVLHVQPGEISQLDFLTTVNNLTAYGDAQAMLIALAGDRYGNPVSDDDLNLSAQFPGTVIQSAALPVQAGFGWTWLRSMGMPGRVRLTLRAGSLERTLELAQMPSAPARVALTLAPKCLLDDGRDLITLQARVSDVHGSPVANRTMVQFDWYEGSGSAQVFDGVASLRVPAPTADGRYTFRATSGSATSLPALVVIQAEDCI